MGVILTVLALETLALALSFDAVVVEGVATHEMNGWQGELLLALAALFGGEGLRLSADLNDFRLHLGDGVHVLVDLLF